MQERVRECDPSLLPGTPLARSIIMDEQVQPQHKNRVPERTERSLMDGSGEKGRMVEDARESLSEDGEVGGEEGITRSAASCPWGLVPDPCVECR